MRKLPFGPALFCVVLGVAHARGQDRADAPDGVLVRCGTEQVATFSGTESKDRRFAVGWTIRARGNEKAPAPWAAYNGEVPAVKAGRGRLENEDGSPRKGNYRVVDGLVDLKAKRFTPWQSEEPHYAGRARGSMEAVWSGDRQGTQYGVILNNHEGNSHQATTDLQLVVIGPDEVHLTDLKPATEGAIRTYLHKRDPKDAVRYAWICTADVLTSQSQGRQALTLFKGEALTLPFTASIPGEPQNVDAGRVSFALPQGTVTGTTSDAAAREVLLP